MILFANLSYFLTLFLTYHFSLIFLFIFVMQKLFFLILFNLMYINISATIRNIDPNIYEHLKDQDDINLVLLYEKWCSHSDEV